MDHNYINEAEDEHYFPVEVELEEIEKDGDSLLIDLVKRYPYLYNRTSMEYKDVLVKENTWQEIAVMMSMPVAECQNRWLRLRERYTKEKRLEEKERKTGSSNDIPKRRPWHLFSNMSFLSAHIRKRRSFRPIRPLIQSVRSLTAAELANSPEEFLCNIKLLPEMLPSVKTEVLPPATTELSTVGSSVSTAMVATTASSPIVTTGSSPVATVEASSTTSLSLPKLLSSDKTKCQACEDRHKRKVGDDLEQSCLSLSSIISKLVENSPSRKSLDEDDLFGELVTAELKKMKSGEKESVKMELSKILYCRRNSQQ